MFLKVLWCLYFVFSFFGVRPQRTWGTFNSGFKKGFSNIWNQNNGFSSTDNNIPFSANYNNNNNHEGSWGSGFLINRPNDNSGALENNKKSGWSYEAPTWNSNKSKKPNSEISNEWQPDDLINYKRPNGKKLSSIMNLPSSSWNANSNNIPSNFIKEEALAPYSGSKNLRPSEGQNSKPENWSSNNITVNKPSESYEPDYNENSLFPTWSSNDSKKPNSESNTFGDYNNWESTTQKKKNFGPPKWEKNYNIKPQTASTSSVWYSNNTQPERKKNPAVLDLSILDELDKNDWYFRNESNYPKPPFRSTININVSELWNFDKNKKPNQKSRLTTNNNSFNRRNRHIESLIRGANSINCVCVNVNFCEEEDMIITQEDLKSDIRPLSEFKCAELTEVCCTNPKIKLSGRTDLREEKERLQCGQRKLKDSSGHIGDNIAEPGEFPWVLKIENSDIDCSASLIHHKLAMTAAHCVNGFRSDELMLKAGLWNSNNESLQSRKVSKIIPHPDYNSQNPRNDIALLVLETPFKLTDNVNTICLPVTNDKWDSNQCVVSSWKSEKILGQVLEKGAVNFLPQAECQNIMLVTDLWRNYVLHDSFVCGKEKTGRDSCTGTEGGFVACPSQKRPATYLQIGIISKGMNCDNFGRPGIFTNVLMFLDWINRNYFELELFDDIDIRNSQ